MIPASPGVSIEESVNHSAFEYLMIPEGKNLVILTTEVSPERIANLIREMRCATDQKVETNASLERQALLPDPASTVRGCLRTSPGRCKGFSQR
jgi:hypothetical protein